MPKARSQQVSLQDTCYYHCVSRCVRRSFLCGQDPYSGKSYEHRRQWVEDRLLQLAEVFAISVCAFAVMSNHTHVVLCIEPEQVEEWDTTEVIQRWHRLYGGTALTQRYCQEEERQQMAEAELNVVEDLAEQYLERLMDISWFMRALNEPIARMANREDGCTGRFWEGRFKSQALLDEQALLSCMAYVDLNPIRANIAKTPEGSHHTSIRMRIQAALKGEQPVELKRFSTQSQPTANALPCHLNDYLELIEFTGRAQRLDKPGHIADSAPELLTRLGIILPNWITLTQGFEYQFGCRAGTLTSLQHCHGSQDAVRIRGSTNARRLFAA
ncbi:transposase [Ferrimonas balearica]|uniref:transposase n=1 Tax=Ferrimonas balearica TaxID=44012 RepID=UPI001C98ED95|nr:transposase [Ferrimonas balearica]MBY5921208.1 transposase [Ferrimonas balearica]MBY5996107.1 transposase [Ferrimonas balearica]